MWAAALHACLLAVPRPGEQGLAPLPTYGEKVAAPAQTPEPTPDPHATDWYPHGEVKQFCKEGITDRQRTVCCPKTCGECGGGHCANQPGGAAACCHEDIMHGNGINYCETETNVTCVMPLTCEKDQCLPMCPLHPGCSIIWAARGLDYEQVRKQYYENYGNVSLTADEPL